MPRLRSLPRVVAKMTEVDERLRAYIQRFESGGETDPADLLKGLDPPARAELSALIEGYLEHGAPPAAWDPDAFEGSISERAVARVAEQWSAASGELPHELVALRNERKLMRREVVARLAEKLGFTDDQEKVGFYYHQLERGLLPSEGVSSKVFDALSSILDTSTDVLRRAGESVAPSAGGEPDLLMARMAPAPGSPVENTSKDRAAEDQIEETTEEDWDEVDRLFRAGG